MSYVLLDARRTVSTRTVYAFTLFVALQIGTSSLARASQVFSFGTSNSGQTGLGFSSSMSIRSPTPIDATNITGETITKVSAGGSHSLLLANNGTVFSFGGNYNGRTGLGTSEGNTSSATLIDMANLTGETISYAEAGGAFSLLLTDKGDVFSFGDNSDGQSGVGNSLGDVLTASPVNNTHIGNRSIAQVAAGSNHSLLLAEDGALFSFGRSTHGQTGLGTDDNVLIPTPIDMSHLAGKIVTQIAAGRSHSLLLTGDGTVFSFGDNQDGQTGQGIEDFDTLFPRPIDTTHLGDRIITQISTSNEFSLLLAKDGTVFSFGGNYNGRTGLGINSGVTLVPTPIDTSNLHGKKVVQVAAGYDHSLLLADDGTVFSFGDNSVGQLGQGRGVFGDILIATPIDMTGLEDLRVTQVVAGGLHSLLLTSPLPVPEPTSVVLTIFSIVTFTLRRSRRSRFYSRIN